MSLLLNKKLLFVHISKSCGSVITRNFKKVDKTAITGRHRTLQQMLNIAKKEYNINQNELYMFTFVRNPWERMLSMYLFYHKNNFNAKEFYSNNKEIDNDFNKWIEFIYSDNFNKKLLHGDVNIFKYCFSNQLNWVKDNKGDIIKGINLFKIENTNPHDFLTKTLNLQDVDGNTRLNTTKHEHYSKYYNKKSIKLVEEHYKEDINYFNYKFETK